MKDLLILSPLELNDVTFKNQDGLINGIFNAKVNKSGTVYIYVSSLNGHVSFPISKVSFHENSGRTVWNMCLSNYWFRI